MPTLSSPTPAIHCHAQAAIDAQQVHPHKKKIFVFCDGTGNEFQDTYAGGDGNSNVVKLYTTLRVNNTQVAYYHPGVGTMGDPTIHNPVLRFWSKAKGLGFGAGFQDNVLDAYRYLMEVYNDGDEIYVFGFSRGAYTARALVGMLHGYGLLCRGNEGHLLYAWNMFHDAVKKSRALLKKDPTTRNGRYAHTIQGNFSFAQTYSRHVTIRFIGIWDTVSSVGWIYKPLRLLDMSQNPIILTGRHAVSIDERRANYRDNLWGPPVDINHPEWPEDLRAQGIQQDLAQVWFPGAHSDVGGSYPQPESAPANEALRWMIGEIQNNGAELCQERIDMVLGTPSGVYSADVIYTPAPPPDDHIHDSLAGKWWLLQLFPQQHYDKTAKKIQWRVPYGSSRTIPDGAIVHSSVVRRLDGTTPGQKPYTPRNLKRNELQPLTAPVPSTTADLTGCAVYHPGSARTDGPGTGVRLAQVFLGWITFGLFWLVVGTILWFALNIAVYLVHLLIRLLLHVPTLGDIFHCVAAHFKH